MENLEMARRLAQLVAEQGGRVYYVGGFVRDRLLGLENKDVDVEVHGIAPAALEAILDRLGTRREMGRSFGVYGLSGWELDIAMPRKETATGRGHRDFQVDVDPFLGTEKAALRRDFTVNAMMEDVLTGEILDHFGGREDLRRGILRHVSDSSFGEDALRVLRCAQFAARFEFAVDPETIALCKTMDLRVLARERVMEELRKALLKAERPSIFFEVLGQMDRLSHWFPEVAALRGVPQNPRYHAEGDVWTHTMLVLDQAARRRDRAEQPLPFLLAALCHDFGKAICTEFLRGDYRSYKHEVKGLPLVKTFLKRLTAEKHLTGYVLNMTLLHMRPNKLEDRVSIKSSNHLFDEALCPEDLIHLSVCDDLGRILAEPVESKEPLLWKRLEIYREYMARPAVVGADLIEMGLQPGPEFRELLAYAHKLRLAGVPKKDALAQTRAMARQLAKEKP